MIRRATTDDVEEIAKLYERSFATLDYLPVLHTLDEHRRWFGRQLAEHEGWVWDQDGIRGFSVRPGDGLLSLPRDVGGPGRGTGPALPAHAKERRPEGFPLGTSQQNGGARRFYERYGLTAIEFTAGEGNEEKMPDVRYAWTP